MNTAGEESKQYWWQKWDEENYESSFWVINRAETWRWANYNEREQQSLLKQNAKETVHLGKARFELGLRESQVLCEETETYTKNAKGSIAESLRAQPLKARLSQTKEMKPGSTSYKWCDLGKFEWREVEV